MISTKRTILIVRKITVKKDAPTAPLSLSRSPGGSFLNEKGETNAPPTARTIRVGGFTCVRVDLTVAAFANVKRGGFAV